jgi:hypothetical protein
VEKVAQSKQLGAADHPEILVLFENWLEELESPTTDNVSGLDLQLIFKTLCLSCFFRSANYSFRHVLLGVIRWYHRLKCGSQISRMAQRWLTFF